MKQPKKINKLSTSPGQPPPKSQSFKNEINRGPPPVPHHPKPKGQRSAPRESTAQRERERERERRGKGRQSPPRPTEMADRSIGRCRRNGNPKKTTPAAKGAPGNCPIWTKSPTKKKKRRKKKRVGEEEQRSIPVMA